MTKNCFFILLVFIGLCSKSVNAQSYGIALTGNKKTAVIPFEKHGNLIIVPIWLNHGEILNFIIDTGARYTILTEKSYIPQSKMTVDRQIQLIGSDMKTTLTAYRVPNMNLRISNVYFRQQTLLVLAEDYLRLESLIGVPIHGILGADLFKRFIVKIDYIRSMLVLYERGAFVLEPGFEALDIIVEESKPYLYAPIKIGQEIIKPYLLLDTGASLGLMLHPNVSEQIQLPDNAISGSFARGLGGEVEGMMGRVEGLELKPFEFRNIVTHFQDLSGALDTVYIDDREGLIGGEILNRFAVIFDYHKKKLYLKPNRKYNRAFNSDRSGLVILVAGKYLRNYIIKNVIPNSPAAEAGVLPDDELIRLNFQSTNSLTLQQITRILQGRPNKRIRLVLYRDGKKVKVQFRLKDLI